MRCGRSKAGATKRHMPWSQPKPCANTIGGPSARPPTVTALRSSTSTARTLVLGGGAGEADYRARGRRAPGGSRWPRPISWTGSAPPSAATAARWRRCARTTWPRTCCATLVERHPGGRLGAVDDVLLGCANQAGEDNRNVARMAALLAGLPVEVPGAHGQPAVRLGARRGRQRGAGGPRRRRRPGRGRRGREHDARAVRHAQGDDGLLAGDRDARHDARLAVRQPGDAASCTAPTRCRRPRRTSPTSTASPARTRTRSRCARRSGPPGARRAGGSRGRSCRCRCRSAGASRSWWSATSTRGRPRSRRWPGCGRSFPGGTVTAGNSSGVNDGAAALLVASERAVERYGLTPLARVTSMAATGVPPRVMGIGPVPATRKLLDRAGLTVGDVDVVELNEAFAAQALAVLRGLGLPDDAEHVNPQRRRHRARPPAGHERRAAGADRPRSSCADRGARRAVVTMCIGVGQGIAVLLEARVTARDQQARGRLPGLRGQRSGRRRATARPATGPGRSSRAGRRRLTTASSRCPAGRRPGGARARTPACRSRRSRRRRPR